jgi:predicted nucleic acid-binding protein
MRPPERRIVLDAAAFDILASRDWRSFIALVEATLARGASVWCSAVTIAEVARGDQRTRAVEAILRGRAGITINVQPTDEAFAKLVGSILHTGDRGSAHIADAHVVATCAGADFATVITADPDDIVHLAAAIPGTRVGIWRV